MVCNMKKNVVTRSISVICAAMMCGSSLLPVSADGQFQLEDSIPVQAFGQKPTPSAQAYALMDAHTGRLILGDNETECLPMASTTKIMTALIALEQQNIDEYFTVDAEAIKVEGSSMGLMQGDQVSLRMLAYGMLLPSGNDAANAAAVKIAGSITDFAVLMNQRAQQIGMTNSQFVTPSGLHDDAHYSTAYDMALLTRVAMENQDFAQICSATKAQVSFGSPPFERWLANHNRLLKYYDDCIGVKTGFTKKAGRCLVSAAERVDGGRFICVTLNAPQDWNDHTALLDYGFSMLQEVSLTPQAPDLMIPVVGSQTQTVRVAPVGEAVVRTTADKQDITQRVVLNQFVYAPVQKGDCVGSIDFVLGERVLASVPLIAAESAYIHVIEVKLTLWDRVKQFFGGLFERDNPQKDQSDMPVMDAL